MPRQTIGQNRPIIPTDLLLRFIPNRKASLEQSVVFTLDTQPLFLEEITNESLRMQGILSKVRVDS